MALRGADGDEDDFGVGDPRGQVGGEFEAAVSAIAGDEFGQAGLVDGDFATLEHVDFFGDLVDADDVIAAFCETGARDQAHVTGTHNGELHTSDSLSEEGVRLS